jgi:small subunit ribosomal protein S18
METEEKRQFDPLELTHLDTDILSRWVTDTGKILPRRITGLTARQQRHITRVIKQSRNMLLMK